MCFFCTVSKTHRKPCMRLIIVLVGLLQTNMSLASSSDDQLPRLVITETISQPIVKDANGNTAEINVTREQASGQARPRSWSPASQRTDLMPQTNVCGSAVTQSSTQVLSGRATSARPGVVSDASVRKASAQVESQPSAVSQKEADDESPKAFDPAGKKDDASQDAANALATEKLMLLLEKRRRASGLSGKLPASGTSPAPALNLGEGDPRALRPVPNLPSNNLDGPVESRADVNSDDPLKQDRAQRWDRLKVQLLQLKSQYRPVPNKAAATDSETSTNGELGNVPGSPPSKIEFFPATEPSSNSDASDSDPEKSQSIPSSDSEPPSVSEDAAEVLQGADAEDMANEDASGESMEQSAASDPTVEQSSSSTVVGGEIDRLGLANNLYAVGDYGVALEIYSNNNDPELTPQQKYWVDFQAANCLRRMGKHAEASNRFRKIAGNSEAGWLSEKARWWVIVLEKVRQAEKDIAEDPSEEILLRPVPVSPPRAQASQSQVQQPGLIERPASGSRE